MDVLEDIGRVQRELLLNNSLFTFVVYLNSHLNVGISFIPGVSLSGYHATGLTLPILEGHFLHSIFLNFLLPCLLSPSASYYLPFELSQGFIESSQLTGDKIYVSLIPSTINLTHGESLSSGRLHTFLFLFLRVFRVSSYPTPLSFLKLSCLYIPFSYHYFMNQHNISIDFKHPVILDSCPQNESWQLLQLRFIIHHTRPPLFWL